MIGGIEEAMNISTHSLTRRLTFWRASCFCAWCISTHSLTRRLTSLGKIPVLFLSISTHSLTRRLTLGMVVVVYHQVYFNSQPHKEADANSPISGKKSSISTHSLTRRLTLISTDCDGSEKFQLTASQGG